MDTGITTAEVVLPCEDLAETLAFFERLGFGVRAIFPADDPSVAVIAGHGLRIRLERGRQGSAGVVRLLCLDVAAVADGQRELTAPNGTRVELVDAEPPLQLPPLQASYVLSRESQAAWGVGRAGMVYRDLIPDRQGGRFVGSHIKIPGGGPVPDYVHFHKVRFQLIFCRRGWVRVVYEGQGPPFVLNAGDCVLQPPQIRHRVLESSPGLEVVEIGCPAEHETLAHPELSLPTPELQPGRSFSGQQFVRHVAATATWRPWRLEGFEARDSGIAEATAGVAGVQVVRPVGTPAPQTCTHDAELLFLFVLEGGLTLSVGEQEAESLQAGDAFVVPAGESFTLSDCAQDLELLEVTLPGAVEITLHEGASQLGTTP